jgi:adenylate cyclase
VNTTARLASTAAAGEILVSLAAAEAAGQRLDSLERRSVAIRGRQDPIDVVVIRQS